jgi:hypothetical protein
MDIELFVPHTSMVELLNSPLMLFTLISVLVVVLCFAGKDHWLLNRSVALAVIVTYLFTVAGSLVLPAGLVLALAVGGLAMFLLNRSRHRSAR